MNAPTPYAGNEKYIFISYSHKDSFRVVPVITRLMAEGYRVWYDMGIDPGTEWDENIAQHIKACGYFIAFMSANYLASSNCKDELNYARDLEKDRLLVYLESVELPSGMAMRVNRLQSIFKYTYSSEEAFFQKLFTANNINACHKDGINRNATVPPEISEAGSQPYTQPVSDTPPVKPEGTSAPKSADADVSNHDATDAKKRSALGGFVCSIFGATLYLVAILFFPDGGFWSFAVLLGAALMFARAYFEFKDYKVLKVNSIIITAFCIFSAIFSFIV